jgi:myo-inositol 2-dehydrogenase/D-chiro-inositol 1-dehydrogenase
VTATGYHWRYLGGIARARELHNTRPVRLVTGAWLDKVPPPAWWIHREQSGGQIVEQATHLLDCMLDVAGDVNSVYALGRQDGRRELPDADIDTSAVAVLSFRGGALGTLAATSLLPSKARASVEFVGEGWRMEVAETHYVLHDGDGPVERADSGDAKRLVDRTFIDAVQGRPGDVRAPYDLALMTHRVGCAIAESPIRGTRVEIGEM